MQGAGRHKKVIDTTDKPKYAHGQTAYDYFRPDGTPIDYPDILMWVGKRYYPLPKDFIEEARRQGLSKRIQGIPDALVIGGTRLFMAHLNAIPNPAYLPPLSRPAGYDEKTKEYLPGIIAMTVIEKVELIVDYSDPDSMAKLHRLEEIGVTPVKVQDVRMEAKRGCGFRKPNAIYMVTSAEFSKMCEAGVADGLEIRDCLMDIVPPIPFPGGKQHRSFDWVDGDAIMEGTLPDEWWLKRVKKTQGVKKAQSGGGTTAVGGGATTLVSTPPAQVVAAPAQAPPTVVGTAPGAGGPEAAVQTSEVTSARFTGPADQVATQQRESQPAPAPTILDEIEEQKKQLLGGCPPELMDRAAESALGHPLPASQPTSYRDCPDAHTDLPEPTTCRHPQRKCECCDDALHDNICPRGFKEPDEEPAPHELTEKELASRLASLEAADKAAWNEFLEKPKGS